MTAAQRLAKSLKALERQGGRQVSLRLSPQAAGVVRDLLGAARFRNLTECVNEAIVRLAPDAAPVPVAGALEAPAKR